MIRRAFLAFAAMSPFASAQSDGFSGRPLVRIDADGGDTKRVELSDEAGMKYTCRIVKKGRRFTWSSRGDRELTQSFAGDWVYYISPEGSGYVKVYRGGGDMPYDYIEHLTSELKTVTYWGKKAG
ncbi:MAG TPA: hypothetical protein VEQ63_10405 [Bryobacteraceae bacterium]|nr:hypothetical protein [Bryobacteraceae bacterium]